MSSGRSTRGRGQRRGRPRNRTSQSRSPSRRRTGRQTGVCFSCGADNHYARSCPQRRVTSEQRTAHRSTDWRGDEEEAYLAEVYLAEANVVTNQEVKFAFDTAATHHFCRHRDWFTNYRELKSSPALTAEGTSNICGIGDIVMETSTGRIVTLKNVMHAPNMRRNLISGNRIFKSGGRFQTNDEGIVVVNPKGEVVLSAPSEENFFIISAQLVDTNSGANPCQTPGRQTTRGRPNLHTKTEVHGVEEPKREHPPQNTSERDVEKSNDRPPLEPKSRQHGITDPDLWHMRLGHLHEQGMWKMIKSGKVKGITHLSGKMKVCDPCKLGKATHAKHVAISERRSKAPLDLVHTDVWGPAPITSHGGAKYFISFVDDFSRKSFIYPMRSKDEAFAKFQIFLAKSERQTGRKLKCLRSDNGTEYCANYFETELRRLGIKAERTNVYSPMMNGVAERLNRTLMDSVRTHLIAAKLCNEWWMEMTLTASYLRNKNPHSGLNDEIPDSLYFNRPPSVGHLKRIGSLCYLYDESRPRTKLRARAKLGVLIGYAIKTRGYRIWLPDEGKAAIKESMSVRFDERRLGVEVLQNAQQSHQEEDHDMTGNYEQDAFTDPWPTAPGQVQAGEPQQERTQREEVPQRSGGRAPLELPPKRTVVPGRDTVQELAHSSTDPVGGSRPLPGWSREVAIRKTGRDAGKACIYYRYLNGPRLRSLNEVGRYCIAEQIPYDQHRFDFYIKNTRPAKGDPVDVLELQTRGGEEAATVQSTSYRSRITLQEVEDESDDDGNDTIEDYHTPTSSDCDEGEVAGVVGGEPLRMPNPEACCAEIEIPETYQEAMDSPYAHQWKRAMDEEMSTLGQRRVFTEVKKPKTKKTIGTKWVYTVKDDAQKKSKRFRARLVAQGNTQKKGVDYFETYSPVISFTLVRLFFVLLVVCLGWTSAHLDVKCAYLYGNLDEETYLKPAPGYGNPHNTAWKLHKALYGLHQSGRRWFEELDATFKDIGFTKVLSTNCIYTYKRKAIVLVYVDDLAVFARDEETKTKVIALIARKFEIKDLGLMRRFLGVEFEDHQGVWKIHQKAYISKLTKIFDLENARIVYVPLDVGVNLTKGTKQAIGVVDATNYRSLIGALMFLATRTRPDLLYAVTALSQYNSSPTLDHWRSLQRVLVYAKSTEDLGICCKVNTLAPELTFYTDSSWASSVEDRRSWSGYVGLLAGVPVTWRVQKQKSVALSTIEAEFVGMANAVVEMKWLTAIFKELYWLPPDGPMVLHCDNQAAMAFAQDHNEHNRTKHIDIKFKFVREAIIDGMCVLKFVRSKQNIADVFTKALPRNCFEQLRRALVN